MSPAPAAAAGAGGPRALTAPACCLLLFIFSCCNTTKMSFLRGSGPCSGARGAVTPRTGHTPPAAPGAGHSCGHAEMPRRPQSIFLASQPQMSA